MRERAWYRPCLCCLGISRVANIVAGDFVKQSALSDCFITVMLFVGHPRMIIFGTSDPRS